MTRAPALGERAALRGYGWQYDHAAELVYDALVGNDFEELRLCYQKASSEEDVQRLEGERLHGEEVRSPELRAVVGEEGSPGLGRRTPQRPPPIAPHRLRAHLVAERE